MNITFDNGAQVSTSYRNSKNYDSNWISAGYSIWFLREAKYLNQARLTLNTSCTISGTGFFVSAEILRKHGGWKWNLLTEDVEFSAQNIIEGERISYTPSAILYDEQPTLFKDSWNQRFRWAKGFYQVLVHYGTRLVSHSFTNPRGKRFACYDMLMTIAPGAILTIISLTFNAIILVLAIIGWMPPDIMVWSAFTSVCFCFISYLAFMFVFGAITTFSEWKNIRAASGKKILYMFTFPFFMLTYVPIALVALVKKAEWKQVAHTMSVNIEDFFDARGQKAQKRKQKGNPQKAFFE
jgi:cellulose synthase/poly-beta-1,6-N-acetylglucosamine synthase-like glycosyltransferase